MAAQISKIWLKQLLWQSAIWLSPHSFVELLASINYTKQNKSFIIFITQEKYSTEENKIQKSTKLV